MIVCMIFFDKINAENLNKTLFFYAIML